MNIKDYPFAQDLITDNQGQIQQVIINFEDYQQMIETYEDTGLYRAMIEVKNETPLSLEEALAEVINSLDLTQKQQLLEILEQQIFEAEEDSYQDDEETLAELKQVRNEYQSGDYVTLEQYLIKD